MGFRIFPAGSNSGFFSRHENSGGRAEATRFEISDTPSSFAYPWKISQVTVAKWLARYFIEYAPSLASFTMGEALFAQGLRGKSRVSNG